MFFRGGGFMSSFFIGVLVGAVIGFFAYALMTARKHDELEEKMWELERYKFKLEMLIQENSHEDK